MSVKELEPDFVLNVKHSSSDEKLKPKLKQLLDTLEKAGFGSLVRAGADPSSEVLVFLRLLSTKYGSLVEQDLVRSYQFGVSAGEKEPYNRSRLIYQYLLSSQEIGGVGLTIATGQWDFVTSITAISGYLADDSVQKAALDDLKKPEFLTEKFERLYGPQVALYFDFLKTYTFALGVLAVFGLVATLKSKNYSLTFAFLNVLWGSVFLIYWRRREKFLSNIWGVQNSLEAEKYQSEVITAAVSGEQDSLKLRTKHDGLRLLKQFAFIPVAIGFTAVLVSYQLACFVLEIYLTEVYDGPGVSLLALVPTVLISVFVPVLTIVFNLVSEKFLDWEDHKSNLTRTQSSVTKTFVLNFLTGYAPLIITAFIYLPFAHLLEPNLVYIQRTLASNIRPDRYIYKYLTRVKSLTDFQINQGRLNSQFFYFIVTNQVISLVVKYGVPLLLPHIIKLVNKVLKGKQPEYIPENESAAEKAWLDKVRSVTSLPEYSTDDDFRIITLQYGYLALFGPVWTLAPFICIFFNLLNFKLDEYKLASGKYYKPLVAKRIDTIYPWNIAFFLLTWLGSIISPVITAFYRHGTKPPKPLGQFALDKASVNVSSSAKLILVLFLSEHIFFLVHVLGGKIADLFKSDQEIANDSLTEDVKLRGEYFSNKEKPQFDVPSDGNWASLSAASAIKQADSISLKKIEPEEQTTKSGDEKDASAALTSVSKAPASEGTSVLTNKQELLEQKKRDLEEKRRKLEQIRQEQESKLEARMEKGDRIVDTRDEKGLPSRAIMDDNLHADQYGEDYEKNVNPQQQGTYNKEQIANGANSKGLKTAAGIAVGSAGGAAAISNNDGFAGKIDGARSQVNEKIDSTKQQINDKLGGNKALDESADVIGKKVDGIEKNFNDTVDEVTSSAKNQAGGIGEKAEKGKGKINDLTGELDNAKNKAQKQADQVQKKVEDFNPSAGEKVGDLKSKVEKTTKDRGNLKESVDDLEEEAKKSTRKKSFKNLLKRK